VPTNVGWFSLFCENRPVLVLTSCYENLISLLIYFVFWLVGTDQGIKGFNFFKFTRFLNKVVLTYTITIGPQIQFSQPIYYIFQQLKFNILIMNLFSL